MGDSCCYETMMAGMLELCRKLHKIYISSRNLFPGMNLEFGDAQCDNIGSMRKTQDDPVVDPWGQYDLPKMVDSVDSTQHLPHDLT